MELSQSQEAPFGTEDQRYALNKAFFNLTKHWQLSNEQIARLFGWTYSSKRTKLDNMRAGKTPLPEDQDKFERVQDLINIHTSLRVLFPNRRKLVYEWVKVPRERFGGYSALDIMLEDGKSGISAIRRYLDYERTR